MTSSPLAAYDARVASGGMTADPAQRAIAADLDALARALAQAQAAPPAWAFWRKAPRAPAGLYLYGPVGRGKSMLMDLFFTCAPVTAKRRVHFHAFMQEIHGAIFRYRQGPQNEGDPVSAVARQTAATTRLLCFDEFQVLDAADAMILARLFTALWDAGVTTVITSNRPPDDLYKHGLNRPLFLPFIALLKEQLTFVELAGATDYRRNRIKGHPTWIVAPPEDARAELDALFAALTENAAFEAMEFEVHGHRLTIPAQAKGVARASFDELCRRALGPADYLTLAAHFHTLVLDAVPRLGADERNAAKRFVTLIDALYEARAKLVASAEASPAGLYREGDGRFEFERTVSRLEEMQSEDYWRQPHEGAAP